MVTFLLRPELGRKAYRLRCRFTIDAFPKKGWLEKAKFDAAEAFVRDMAKQGWVYEDKHGFKMTGPFAPLSIVNLPSRHQQAQWHMKSSEMLPRLNAGQRFGKAKGDGYVSLVPPVAECDQWDFELAGVFVHETLLVETADSSEEKRILANR